MAVTRLSDAIVPEIFFSYMLKETKEKSALYGAGVMADAPEIQSKLAGGGRTFQMPFWNDLDNTESNVASDDPTSDATPGKITSSKDIALRQVRTYGWSTADLVRELAGDDPMGRISSRAGAYWGRQFDRIAIASLNGVIADNVANDSGDMVNDIGNDVAGTPADTTLFSAEAVMDTAQTLGDAKQDLAMIIMHSVVHNRLSKQQLIDYRLDADGTTWFPYFLDYRIHVSDMCPAVAGTNQTLYTTYLMGPGALAWSESPVATPVEVERKPAAADGMGVEELWTRRQFCIHPPGIKWTDTTVTGEFPTNAELALAANWDRVYAERKQIKMAVLKTNG